MRILIDLQSCQNASHGRGIGRYALAMARALVRNGRADHEFRILLNDRFPERIEAVRQAFAGLLPLEDIVVLSVPDNVASAVTANLWRTRAGEIAYVAAVESFEPDVFFNPSLFEGFGDNVVVAVEPGDYLRAATVHDLIPLEDPGAYLVGDTYQRSYSTKIAAMRRCDCLFSVSDYTKSQVVSRLGIREDKIVTLTLGVEEAFCTGAVSRERERELRERYGLRGRFLINTSPYETRKNIQGLIAGFACVAPSARKDVQLAIAGKMSAHDREHIAKRVRGEGLKRDDVLLLGFVPDEDLIDLYRLCEAMVFPSLSEGFGLPPLEAMACGAAVIASNATSVPEVIGRSDALFDPANPGDMGALIQKVLEDEVFRADLRAFGPRQAATFSWDRSAQTMLRTFEARRKFAPRSKVARASGSGPVRRLAVAAVSGSAASRESGVVEDFVRLLGERYEVVAFPLQGELSPTLTEFFSVRPEEEFIASAGEFDRVLYILDSSQTEVATPYMAARPGALLLYDRLLNPPAANGLTRSHLRDLFAERGYDAISTSARTPAVSSRGWAAASLVEGFAVEGDSPIAGRRGARSVTPHVSLATVTAVEAFRQARGIPADAPVWTAFVADDEAEADLIRRFRSSAEAEAWLIVASAANRDASQPMPGRVFRMSDAYVGAYRELLSATSLYIVDEALEAGARERLIADAKAHGVSLRLFDRAREGMGAPVDGLDETDRTHARHGFAQDLLGVIEDLLVASPRPLAAPSALLERLPFHVEGVRPDLSDLDELARVVVANQELAAEGRVLIDVTAAVGKGGGLSSSVRRFLKALLADSGAILVARDAGGYYRSGRFTADMLGAPRSALTDERVRLRPRDVMVLADALGARFDDSEGSARPAVRSVELMVEDALSSRPDLGEEIVAAAREEMARIAPDVASLRTWQAPRGGATGSAAKALADALEAPVRSRGALDLNYSIYGHVEGSYSLAMVNRRIALVLDENFPGRVRFVPVETTPVEDLSRVPAEDRKAIEGLVQRGMGPGAEVVIAQHYPMHPPALSADVGLALLAWEESHLPPSTVDLLNDRFDGVLAQVRSVRKALVDSGVWKPSVLTGLPVDLAAYEGVCGREGPAKTFLHVSSCFPRKGVDVLLEAWARAFSDADGVTLVIKTFPNPHNDVEAQIAELRRIHPRLAPIRVVNKDMETTDLVALYRSSDVMVLPTRGEGYNLPAMEALAAGLPLIVTGHGGHMDFCSPNEARVLDYEFQMSSSHVKECVSYWANPSVDDLVEALREQTWPDRQAEIEARRAQGRVVARKVTDARRWSANVNQFAQALMGPIDLGPVRTNWISTWAVRCGIAEYSRFLFEHMSPAARAEMTMLADVRVLEAAESDEVRRIASWELGHNFKAERLLEAIAREDAEAVVIQHQDGLIVWKDLAKLALSDELADRVSVITLHTVRSLASLTEVDRGHVLDGLSRFDRVLVHTVGDLNALKAWGLLDNVALLPHGALRPTTAGPVIRDLGPTSAPVIGCHGFFFDHKRIDSLIRAAARLKPRWPGLKLRLVNARFTGGLSDAAIEHAQAVAQEVGMTASIEWHTDFMAVEEIQSLLSGCDLLVLPYDETGDSVSGAVRVAMSSLSPLLTTPVKIFADVAEAVAMVESNAPDVLAGAIEDLLEAPSERLRIQKAMARWLEIHDWNRIAGTLEGMIKALVVERRLARSQDDHAMIAAE
ncbi:glycosyltransferase [Brevundimonas sp.]|uniref:glycosyltransferase n=1 Tax=Brevundimonas sp. TaxID=1871086 RepID=UPI00289B52A0|nr:glycosyltransferase [Brevundimonas sp.]